MKNRTMYFIIPIAAFAALAGTGFGAWYFGGSQATTNVGLDVSVATIMQGGTLSIEGFSTGDRLWLDQETSTFNKGARGPYISNQEGGTIVSSVQIRYTPAAQNSIDVSHYDFTYQITLTGGANHIDDYVKVLANGATEEKKTAVSFSFPSTPETDGSYVYSLSFAFSYEEGKEPTDVAGCEKMIEDVAGDQISFTATGVLNDGN